MTKEALVNLLTNSLSEVDTHLTNEQKNAAITTALTHFNQLHPKKHIVTLDLMAGSQEFDIDVSGAKKCFIKWGQNTKPWNASPVLPEAYIEDTTLHFDSPITASIISCYGARVNAVVYTPYTLETLPKEYQDIILLRAQAECMRTESFRKSTKPIKMRVDGSSNEDKPQHFYESLISEFKERIRAL